MTCAPVSVVIPVHDGAETIGRALASVLGQTRPPAQVVVVDDHSTDGTAAAVEAVGDPRITLVRAEGRGAGHARNVGVAASDEPLIAFLDADDVWYPDKLETQLPLLDDPQVVFAGGLLHYLGEHGQLLGTYIPFTSAAEATASLRRGETMPLPMSTMLLRREDFLAAGGFDETFRRSQDFELAQRLVRDGRSLAFVPDRALGGYVLHPGGVSASSYREQFLAGELVRARIAGTTTVGYEEWQRHPRLSFRASQRLLSGTHYRRAGVAVGGRRWGSAVGHGALAVLLDPVGVLGKLRMRRRNNKALQPALPPGEVLDLFAPQNP